MGIPEMHLHNQVLFIYLVSYFNTPYKHPHPMLCTNPTCKPARLHEGLRPQPSTPVDAANIHIYFLGFLGLSQPVAATPAKPSELSDYFLLAVFGLNLQLTKFYIAQESKLTPAGSYLQSVSLPQPCPGMPQGLL